MEYLFTCLHPKCTTVRHTGGSAGEGVGQLEQMSLFALIVNYWCRTLYYQKQAQMILLQCLNVTSFSLFFRKLWQCLTYQWHQKGCRGQKAVVCVLKLSSFFGGHMIRAAGMPNHDAGAGSVKICTTGCQAPQPGTVVWNPDKGTGLVKCHREQIFRRAFCAFS